MNLATIDMDPTLRSTSFFFDSESSSVYSDDDLISEANSTGTQIHHRPCLQPIIGDMPRENSQHFERPLTSSLQQGDSPQDPNDFHASILDTSNSSIALYHFESPEEAHVRYQREVARRSLGSIAPLPSADFDTPNHRLSIPYRRHQRVASIGSYAVRDVRDTRLSTASAQSLSLSDAGELAEEYIQETINVRSSMQGSERAFEPIEELAEPPTPPLRAASVSCDPLGLDLASNSPSALQHRSHHNAALRALSSSGPNVTQPVTPADPIHGRSQTPNETLNVPQRQSRVDQGGGLTNGPSRRVYSTTGRGHSLGDHTRGFTSGEYVTDLQESTQRLEERKKSLLKRLCCLP